MMQFTYLAIVLFFIETIIFMFFSNKKTGIKEASMDALTFNSGVILFLYLFGIVFSAEYFSNLDEYMLLAAIGIASLHLMSIADKYYKYIKTKITNKKIKKIW